MSSFWEVVKKGNGFDGCVRNLWPVWIYEHPEPIGYMRPEFQQRMVWTKTKFCVHRTGRSISLKLRLRPNDDVLEVYNQEFVSLCELNADKFDGLATWLQKRDDYHPIRGLPDPLRGLTVPSPLRGILGIVTTGVHLNVYTIRKVNGEDKMYIWLSRRSKTKKTYAGKLDQIVAGGMEPIDDLDPLKTLKREAMEEAGLSIDLGTKAVAQNGVLVGVIEDESHLSFYDLKDQSAGTEEGHLEPGIRFTYDLRVAPTFVPSPKDRNGIERFVAKPVDEVKLDLKSEAWKPNCGLVMLDFLLRKEEIKREEDVNFDKLHFGLRRPLPFLEL